MKFAKSEVTAEDLKYYANNYLDYAKQGIGLGDLSIIRTYEKCKAICVSGNVRIWSTDNHLAAFNETISGVNRRRKRKE